jgi:D-lactate dehydrogenase (cytochrome)
MSHGDGYKTREANPDARRAVAQLTKDVIREWSELGGVHLQIGRKYPYLQTREPATRALIEQFKSLFDPNGIMNPGNLVGLGEN